MHAPRETEVLIIGAGAAGAAAAWRLARAGVAVTCLEQGDWVDHARAPQLAPDWERVRQRAWHPNPNLRRSAADYPIDDSQSTMRPMLFNGVGGSTIMWSCHQPRFHPSDFAMRSLDGVGRDWPLRYAELAPYYALNERMMATAGAAGDPAMPPREMRPTAPAPIGPAERRMIAAFERLGWHWWPGDVTIDTGTGGLAAACNHCGPCELGCPRGAKGMVDVTYWPAAIAAGARLVTGARVAEVTHDAAPRATGAVFIDRAGARHHVAARHVLLAASGIGTPRLMLMSRSGRFPAGIANDNGQVGRGLMLHPLARVNGVFAEPVFGHRGIAAGAIISKQFYETDPRNPFVRGFKLQVMRSHGPALAALGSTMGRVPWGRAHHRRFAEIFDRTLGVSICSDDLPEPHNRIELHDSLVDSDGLPAPRMIYSVGANSRAILDAGMARARELLREAGAVDFHDTPLLRDAGFHLMGACAMGDDPATTVVDRWAECHSLPGLHVVDASNFASAAALNPTNTIQALALRTADRLLARAARGVA
ncbi:MAG: GMC family oxidoreductase [Alphaproteobacteria bacterium]|nr:GMC family oxidoreductase [Alphaproteobacteria bacterium]